MPSIALQRHDVIVVVDTHKDKHIAVGCRCFDRLVSTHAERKGSWRTP